MFFHNIHVYLGMMCIAAVCPNIEDQIQLSVPVNVSLDQRETNALYSKYISRECCMDFVDNILESEWLKQIHEDHQKRLTDTLNNWISVLNKIQNDNIAVALAKNTFEFALRIEKFASESVIKLSCLFLVHAKDHLNARIALVNIYKH